MGLETYNRKRDFSKTREPKGKVARSGKTKSLQFVIQKHDASRLHYDFRLEYDGVLKSWAVPKGPHTDPSKKSLAVQVEDHPLDYGDFEGVIPHGEYGGGTVMLWDRGTWEPLQDPGEGLKAGKMHFILHGEKCKGEWAIIRLHGRADDDGKNWLLFKVKDRYAGGAEVTETKPNSVKTQRTLDAIAEDRDDVWSKSAKKTATLRNATKSAWPKDFSPQLAVLADNPPVGGQWLHEIKFDGYRILAYVRSGNVELLTRNGNEWTEKFASIAASLKKLKVDSAILDGEAVVLDVEGRSDFHALQAMLKHKEKVQPAYYAFDLPFLDGVDLRQTPLLERKKKLAEVLTASKLPANIAFSDHVEGDGSKVANRACGMGLEGIISKLSQSPYVSRRDPSWLKSKCDHRQEFVIIGYTDPGGSRQGFGALLLGVHDDKKRLLYAGRVGTGFDDRLLDSMFKQLSAIGQKSSPTDAAPPARERRHAHWVEPKLVCEVRFTGWTPDNHLRHPAFIALRSDKEAADIVREKPITPDKLKKLEAETASGALPVKKQGSKNKTVASARETKTADQPRTAKSRTASPARRSADATTSDAAKSVDATFAGVRLTHPDKVLYSDHGVTKRQVAEYYIAAQQWMVPQVVDRPLALVRCPGGTSSKCFFQRNYTDTLPAAVDKVNVSEKKTPEPHITVHDVAGIISLAQIGVLEIHTWGCANTDVEHPDHLIFDLDPGPGITFKQMIEGARIVRKALQAIGLPVFVKTSGGKGLHLVFPVKPNVDFDTSKTFCQTIAEALTAQHDLFVANMRKDLRDKKIYLDYHRNGRGATAIAPYSTRARDGAPVSMPISWEELGKIPSANHFTVETAGRYLERRKADPWAAFDKSRVDLHDALDKAGA